MVENIFAETISGGPTSILTKLSSVVVLFVRPLFPGQSIKSIAKGKKPPFSIFETGQFCKHVSMVYFETYKHIS